MKKIIFSILMLCSFGFIFGQDYTSKFSQPKSDNYQVTFDINKWDVKDVTLDGVTYSKIVFGSSVVTQKKGWAELPKISASIQLSADKDVDYTITKSEYTEITLDNPLLPSRGVLYRNQDISSIPYEIDPQSINNKFYPGEITTIDEPFIIRDIRGTTIRVNPFQYNAVTNTLRVYTNIEVTLTEKKETSTNPLLKENLTPVKEVIGMYESIFLNFDKSRYDLPMSQYGEILVVCTSRDEAGIEPWIQWKKEKGFKVTKEVVPTGTNVKNIIKEKYDENNNILYVQLVGDWADIKCDNNVNNSPTDPSMGCVVGTDDKGDIAIGRFSCSNSTELETQVNKSIDYEKNPNMDNYWREASIGIGSSQGATNGDDNEVDKVHIQNIYDNKLEPFTYNSLGQNYEPNASASLLTQQINAGASNIMYCGHGSETSFGTTGFSNSNINQLSNGEMLPFITACACVVGAFHKNGGDCFAEAWLKKQNGGAVITWMSTINQPWDPPMRGQDYFYDILIGGYDYSLYPNQNGITTTEQRTTWGALTVNATNLMLTESSSYSDLNTVKTWTTFGDVSLQLRTKKPDELTISNDVALTGTPFETIVTANGEPVENALVCLSQGDNYYTAITGPDGMVSLENEVVTGECLLVITAFNTTTYYQNINCASPDGAYITTDNYVLDGDGILEPGETSNITLTLKNVGSQGTTGNSTVTLSCESTDLTFPTATATYGPIPANQSITVENGFSVKAVENLPNGNSYPVKVTVTNGSETWESNIVIKVNSPIITFNSLTWPGTFEPGTAITLAANYKNSGGAIAKNAKVTFMTEDDDISVQQPIANIGNIAPGGIATALFTVNIDEDASISSILSFSLEFTADNHSVLIDSLNLSNSCNIVFNMHDTYGDGWNGGKIIASFNDGTPDKTIQLTSGNSGQEIIEVNTGTNMTLTWVKGQYDNEVSCEVFYEADPDNLITEFSNPEAGEIISFIVSCGANPVNILPVVNLEYEVNADNNVILTWEYPEFSNVDGYIIKRDGAIIDSTENNAMTYTDVTTTPNNTYQYCVVVYKDDNVSMPECVTVTTEDEEQINPVRNLTGTFEPTNSYVTLTWDYPETVGPYKNGRALLGYNIYMNGDYYANIDDPTENTFVDTVNHCGNNRDISIEYCVSALYTSGESTKECVNVEITNSIDDDSNIIVYPIPAKDIINISGVNVEKVMLYNSLGQLIYETESNQIDVSSYDSGIYLMNIITLDGKSHTIKVLVK